MPGGVAVLAADKSIIACRLHADQLMVLAGISGQAKLDRLIATAGKGLTLIQTDMTSAYAAFWIFGPHSNDLLPQVTSYDGASMPFGSCAETGVAGVPAILVRPPTPTIANLRILIGWDVAEYVWERIWQAGQKWNVSPLGMDGLELVLSQGLK
jgi:glycine cleavage system aminomethyltransferase T